MTTVSDRRRQPRLETSIPAQVRFLVPNLETQAANVSADGVYFVAKGPLTVEVVLMVGGKRLTGLGHLVRVESKTANHTELGIAVRLDSPILKAEGEPLAENGTQDGAGKESK